MKRLKDFAAECGVSERAIQKHLKNHEEELQGHFERQGPNGTFLDDEAQEFIRRRMKHDPIVVSDGNLLDKLDELNAEVLRLSKKLEDKQDEVTALLKIQLETQSIQTKLEASESKILLLEEKEKCLSEDLSSKENELGELRLTVQDTQMRAEAAELKLQQLKDRNLWKRIFRALEDTD